MTTAAFRNARDFLLQHREDYATAYEGFSWPRPDRFNWALDWFDVIAHGNAATALHIVEEDGRETKLSFGELAVRSDQAANWLRAQGVSAEDRILVMLGNQAELWITALAAMKLRAVVIPATPLLGAADLRDRVERGRVRQVIVRSEDSGKFAEVPGRYTRIAAGDPVEGWLSLDDLYEADAAFTPDGPTRADDPLMLYFTSGTTARPKLVEQTHTSYPIGHLATMYWIGLRPGDVHLNISSPGWAKHAWSCFFAPWDAGATILIYNFSRFDAEKLLEVMKRCEVSTFCAPPTVWRMLVQADLSQHSPPVRECVGAGEPLNPEVIESVQRAWGMTIRDGYGQTETTAQIGNPPGAPLKVGSMGRPLPGYVIGLVDPVSGEVGTDGEICIEIAKRPLGLMTGYRDDADRTADATRSGFYHTGDVAKVDDEGYITYVGRSDDVFKASDYRISPFELESALIEHPAVAEAAVVPSPDPVRLAVPKAFVVLAGGHEPGPDLARDILAYTREHLAPYKRIRRLEFVPADDGLPKTISGKIRRVELRSAEQDAGDDRPGGEYREDDFPDLKG
jgi:acetyl-CoA synthetase